MGSRIALSVLLTLLLVSCGPASQSKSAANPEADQAALKKTRDDFVAAYNSGDAKRIAALYTEDGVIMPQNQETMVGRPAIEAYNKAMREQVTPKIVVTSQELIMIGDDWAYDRGTYMLSVTPKLGGLPIEDVGKYLVILRRQPDGSWKIARDIDNSSKPIPPPPGAKN